MKNEHVTNLGVQTYIISFDKTLASEGRAVVADYAVRGELTIKRDFKKFEELVITTTKTVKKVLHQNAAIRSIEEDRMDFAVDGWSDQIQNSDKIKDFNGRRLAEQTPYGIAMVNANWSGFPGTPQEVKKVCVVDTGYNNAHEDLPLLDEDNDGANGYGQEWHIDGHGHGSHCAGTIGAIGGNDKGVTSVLNDYNNFNFFIGKGLSDSGSGSTSGVIDSMNACANAGANVISMSLGGGGYSQAFVDAAEAVFNAGILLVAAAGNAGDANNHYPASYDKFMSVGAVDSNRQKAGFSVYNDQTEIAAPGVSVLSTITGQAGYASWSGTSMACPHVAGVAALVWGHFPSCTPYQIRQALIQSAERRGGSDCNPQYGFGIVDAKAAYELLNDVGCNGVSPPNVAGFSGGCNFNSTVAGPTPAPTTAAPTPAPTPCTTGKMLEVVLRTDTYPGETSWELTDLTSGTVLRRESGFARSTEYRVVICLQYGNYRFVMNDSYGDGLCCGYGQGYYKLYIDGQLVHEGAEFQFTDTFNFAISDTLAPTPGPTTSPTPPVCPHKV